MIKMANALVGGIIAVSIGVVFLSSVFISTVKGVNTSTWTATEVTLFGLLTISGIIGLVYAVLNVFGVLG